MIYKRKIEVEISVNEETLIKNYPNYKDNYKNVSEFIDSLIDDVTNITYNEKGYAINISKFGNLIVEE